MIEEPPAGHVVLIVDSLGEAIAPPASLRLPPRMSAAALVFVAVLVAMFGVGAAAAIVMLWVSDTPGAWFNTIFTVILGFLALAFPFVYADHLTTAAARALAQRRWTEVAASANPLRGIVTDRVVSLSESGWVSGFRLAVRTDVVQIAATWRPGPAPSAELLQTQVPGIGSVVRVWFVGNGEPVVVEVEDPTVIARPS